jgi:hypothetical protein
MKLVITAIQDIKKGPRKDGNGEWQLLKFSAKNPAGEEHVYTIFNKTSLFPEIIMGATIDCDVETKTEPGKDAGTTFTDRNVTQIFRDGQPVGGQKKTWGGNQKSPEERASIERQVALKCAVDWAIAKGGTIHEILVNAKDFSQFLSGSVPVTMAAAPVAKPTPAIAPPPPPAAVAAPTAADQDFDKLGRKEKATAASTPAPAPATKPGTVTTNSLLDTVAVALSLKSTATARSYLVNVLKIAKERIDTDPAGVWAEVKDKLNEKKGLL